MYMTYETLIVAVKESSFTKIRGETVSLNVIHRQQSVSMKVYFLIFSLSLHTINKRAKMNAMTRDETRTRIRNTSGYPLINCEITTGNINSPND